MEHLVCITAVLTYFLQYTDTKTPVTCSSIWDYQPPKSGSGRGDWGTEKFLFWKISSKTRSTVTSDHHLEKELLLPQKVTTSIITEKVSKCVSNFWFHISDLLAQFNFMLTFGPQILFPLDFYALFTPQPAFVSYMYRFLILRRNSVTCQTA